MHATLSGALRPVVVCSWLAAGCLGSIGAMTEGDVPGDPVTPSVLGGAAGTTSVPWPPLASAGRERKPTDPLFQFDLTAESVSPGLRLVSRDELARAVRDLTGLTPVVS